MIILLDLNYTLVENSHEKARPFLDQIANEKYRVDLIKSIQRHYVILMTARPSRYGYHTIASIREKTGWCPDEYYFNSWGITPARAKQQMLCSFVFPRHGTSPNSYVAIESNPNTRTMYTRHNIPAMAWDNSQLQEMLRP